MIKMSTHGMERWERVPPKPGQVPILGVPITNASMAEALEMAAHWARHQGFRARSLFFANAHTLNLAHQDASVHELLRSADCVFGDGTGVRWAAKFRGRPMVDNVNGTDFVPALLNLPTGQPQSYFMLGADSQTIESAAAYARANFPRWHLTGYHHGFLGSPDLNSHVLDRINRIGPDVLLVGMGNPLQEHWIQSHLCKLNVRVCVGVGGLFDFWSGNVSRAPRWLRRLGHEWVWRLLQQPSEKARRYLIGNPLFVLRILRWTQRDRRLMHSPICPRPHSLSVSSSDPSEREVPCQ